MSVRMTRGNDRRRFRLRVASFALATAAVCCGLMLAAASSAWAAGEPTTYVATETVPVPPASNFAGSGSGDGWSVALSNTQVFNVFHHQGTLQVVCHNQSDASVCFGPDTITDGSGNNFATEGHPGMYYDPNTGKLYVYATRSDNTPGVVCVDTTQPSSNTNPFCGFTALALPGEGGGNDLSTPMLAGNRWYAFNYVNAEAPVGAQDQMLCFDVSTDAACSGQPYAVNIGAGSVTVGGFPSPSTSLIGTQLIVPIVVNNQQEIACLDANTNGNCGGSWPVSLSFSFASSYGAPFPLLDGNGNLQGLCLPTGTDQCYDLSGASTTTPSGMTSVITASDGWNGPALQFGPRVYVPNGNPNQVQCFDYATNASCSNFPKGFSNLGYLYTVNPDPQRPSCIWVNANDGTAQIQNFDAFSGGACGQGSPRAFISQFVNPASQCTPDSYQSLQVITPANAQGTVSFEDADGNEIAPPRQIGANGMVDLGGLNLKESDQFLINLSGDQSTQSVGLRLAWMAPYDATCVADNDGADAPNAGDASDQDTVASNPAITASGAQINSAEGQSFSGTVATFKDPDSGAKASDYKATIAWGDGTTSSGTISGTPSQFKVNGSHTYGEEGSFTVKVTIDDTDSSNDATVSSSAKVADAALHATGVAPALSGTTASGRVATFTDSDPNGALSDYTASINWGDGSTSTGTVSKASGKFAVSGSHTYAKSGSYTVKTTIKDIGGSTATASVTIAAHVKAARVKRGSAHVAAACTAGRFSAQVRGSQISSVKFSLDGRRLRTLHHGKQYSTRTALAHGAHTLTVSVTFRPSSRTRSRTFHRTVAGCALPTFTG